MDLIYKPGDVLTGSNKLTDIEKETISREEYMVLHASENKAIEFYNNQNFLMAYFLWFCAITSFLGALRFQIAKLSL